ncbi:cation transporter [Eubacteriaceae bacterium ES2]|nr:cation transporter [Eubacteriaceae bacterium ES2]
MYKTEFHIKEMDCQAEEQLIRMKLADFSSIKKLNFEIENRKLTIIHAADISEIENAIDSLHLGSSLIETIEISNEDFSENTDAVDAKLLWIVLGINFSFFVIEMLFGFLSNSMGLVADSLDMLADAFVYGLSLYAIAGTLLVKKRIAGISGIFQMILAFLGFIEVVRRFIGMETIPDPLIMIVVSVLALIANSISLVVLNRSKSEEVHIKSSQIFTSNDVIVNIGVIIAGILVCVFKSGIPDLVVGIIVFSLVLRGAIRILKLAKK